MSEFPALRESLVRAAARRRRRRLTIRAAVPAFALAVAAVVLFLVPGGAPDREREVATPARADAAGAGVPRASGGRGRPPTRCPRRRPTLAGADWDGSRLLAKDGDDALYAVPTTEGMCLILRSGAGRPRPGCGPVAAMAREDAAPGTFRDGLTGYLFPDGTHDLTVTTGNGESWGGMGPTPNGVLVRDPAGIAYTAPPGRATSTAPPGADRAAVELPGEARPAARRRRRAGRPRAR